MGLLWQDPSKLATLKIQLLGTTLDIHRIVSRVPANLPLRAFQDRIMSCLFDWKRGVENNMEDCGFYLSASAYPSGRQYIVRSGDIIFAPRQKPDNFYAKGDELMRDAQKIDNSIVCLADFMQLQGHKLLNKHGKAYPPASKYHFGAVTDSQDLGLSCASLDSGKDNPKSAILRIFSHQVSHQDNPKSAIKITPSQPSKSSHVSAIWDCFDDDLNEYAGTQAIQLCIEMA